MVPGGSDCAYAEQAAIPPVTNNDAISFFITSSLLIVGVNYSIREIAARIPSVVANVLIHVMLRENENVMVDAATVQDRATAM